MIPVCHNLRSYANKVFKGFATNGNGTMGSWFQTAFGINDRGEIIAFILTGLISVYLEPKHITDSGNGRKRLDISTDFPNFAGNSA